MMNICTILVVTFFLLSATVMVSDAETTFGGSRITAIDQDQRTITYKTKEGQSWTLPVTDPDLLNQKTVAKDDPVTIEIDLNDRITKVVKPSDAPAAPRTDTEDR